MNKLSSMMVLIIGFLYVDLAFSASYTETMSPTEVKVKPQKKRMSPSSPADLSLEAGSSISTSSLRPSASLCELVDTIRSQITSEIVSGDSRDVILWIKTNVEVPVRSFFQRTPLLETELRGMWSIQRPLYLDREDSPENPLVWIIDRWPGQDWQQAIISGIINPSPIPMFRDTTRDRVEDMSRHAIASRYGDPISTYRIASWSNAHRADESDEEDEATQSRARKKSRRENDRSKLYKVTEKTFSRNAKIMTGDEEIPKQQRYTIRESMIDLEPTRRTKVSSVMVDENENDPRLLFTVGVHKKNTNMLRKSYRKGFLKAGIHLARHTKEKERRKEELLVLKSIIEAVKQDSLGVDMTILDETSKGVDKDLYVLTKKTGSGSTKKPQDEIEVDFDAEALAGKLLQFIDTDFGKES